MIILDTSGVLAAVDASEPEAPDFGAARAVIASRVPNPLGLADASVVVLAHRHSTLDVLTLDHRDFRTLRGPGDQPLRLLPADSG